MNKIATRCLYYYMLLATSGSIWSFFFQIEIEEAKIHESYNKQRTSDDIALIRLRSPVALNTGVAVVCLPSK